MYWYTLKLLDRNKIKTLKFFFENSRNYQQNLKVRNIYLDLKFMTEH